MAIMRINYSKVISQANQIQELSNDLTNQINSLNKMESEVRANWKGQASETFLKKIDELRSNMSKTQQKMSKLSSTIKTVATNIKKEDEIQAQKANQIK